MIFMFRIKRKIRFIINANNVFLNIGRKESNQINIKYVFG